MLGAAPGTWQEGESDKRQGFGGRLLHIYHQQAGAAFYPCKCSLHMSCLFLLEEVFPATVIHNTHRGLEGGWQQPAQLQTGHFKASVVSPASVTAPPQ